MASSLLRTDAPSGAQTLAYPISRVSLSPGETNWYLLRSQPFNVGAPADTALQGLTGPLAPLSAGCQSEPSRVPPMEFPRTLQCPALTIPTRAGCLGVSFAPNDSKQVRMMAPQ